MKRRVGALVSMLVGGAGVLGLLYYMNELTQPPVPEEPKQAASFEVEKIEKKKPPERPRPRPKPRQRTQTARRAPLPSINTALSGLSFDLPAFQTADLMGTDQLLGGAGNDRDLVMTEDSVDSLPRPTKRTAPEYPSQARQRGIQGHVLLKLKVDEGGRVDQVKVIESEPRGIFEDVALAAVRQWQFEPARYKGQPVAISVSQRIPFRLN